MSEKLYDKHFRLRERYGDPSSELHDAYDSWLDDMSNRSDAPLVPFEYDLVRFPEQKIYVPKIEAHDPHPELPDFLYYGGVKVKLIRSLGAVSYGRLSHQLGQQPVSSDDPRLLGERLATNKQEGKNTLVVTSHFDFPELGYFKGLRFVNQKDRPNIDTGGVLLNKLMTRQSYMGKKIVDLFTPVSNVYFSYPKTASAEKHGVPKEATNLGNALFIQALKPDLAKGGLELDVALTGRQIIAHRNESGEVDHYEIPDVDHSSARLVERFDDIVGATLIKSPVTGRYEMQIGEVINIRETLKTNSLAEIVDSIYGEIAKSVEEFTGKEVDYHKLALMVGQAVTQKECEL